MTRRPAGYPRQNRRPAPRGTRPDPARRLAYEVLRAVHDRDAYANLVLPALLRERGLEGRDAAFATELTYGTLRGQGTYDAVLGACVDRPLDQVDPPLLDLLRLGAHQLLAMRVPAHAAVSATVDLARAVTGEGRAKFVNAVLRRVAARDLEGWLGEVAPPYATDPAGHLAVAHAHPRWVVNALRDALTAAGGGSWEETADLLRADNLRPQVTLVARPGQAEVAELVGLGAEPGRWSPYAAVLPEGDPHALEPVRAGRAAVQDEGSQLVALALARAPLVGPDARWLDLCAGPGGKAALLAGLAPGADLLAVELQPHRARLVSRALAHAPGRHQVVVADGRDPAWRTGVFDRVLLDAPCTGLGALRRRPEVRWRRRPEDVPELARLQRELLRSALDAVRPGGLVAYVTCSPHLAETRVVVDDVLGERAGGVAYVDARPLFPAGMPDLGPGPVVQLWPHRHGTDAMFLALLRRVG
ncbi:rRNA cytosine-C5-methyltransferase [Carbonactinospora thermoautotrophica]|uniref:rRNA cytosine-C5-methyltransferase n=2 Tax=Carbonactinospora thermoautotrophica TaxID=1469144 RepID=A0A132N5M8_9ACTN|nr:RsmB/NOP family class I SAM-dependent RNA methyltransferase [Carbonactinospora thermoautotrophica]KWX05297.1 rRNA cytosine-C5-methyltransferase [Carbonactinospora thermoautotrophica]MCX9192995.1 rRNA cytosine-C5-methyltransferase [Carbonactinospora thermoautotrophica]